MAQCILLFNDLQFFMILMVSDDKLLSEFVFLFGTVIGKRDSSVRRIAVVKFSSYM